MFAARGRCGCLKLTWAQPLLPPPWQNKRFQAEQASFAEQAEVAFAEQAEFAEQAAEQAAEQGIWQNKRNWARQNFRVP